jgi:hypothetical protein
MSDLPDLNPSRIRLKAYNLKKKHDVTENKNKTKTTSTSNAQSQNLDRWRNADTNPLLTYATIYSTVSVLLNNDHIYEINRHVG